MKRRLRTLGLVTAGETVALAIWFVWMSRRIDRFAVAIEEAYASE